jgi:hypothetical protein
MARNVSVNSGPLRYSQTVSIGSHVFQSDEPADDCRKVLQQAIHSLFREHRIDATCPAKTDCDLSVASRVAKRQILCPAKLAIRPNERQRLE